MTRVVPVFCRNPLDVRSGVVCLILAQDAIVALHSFETHLKKKVFRTPVWPTVRLAINHTQTNGRQTVPFMQSSPLCLPRAGLRLPSITGQRRKIRAAVRFCYCIRLFLFCSFFFWLPSIAKLPPRASLTCFLLWSASGYLLA